MKDDLGKRMKEQYEDRARYFLPRRTYTLLRIDGNAFHTYTKGMEKPFCSMLEKAIDNSVLALMQKIPGAKIAYCQSDEISILLTDFETNETSAWFDHNVQKLASLSASMMTAHFNREMFKYRLGPPSSEVIIDHLEQQPDELLWYYDPGDIQDILENKSLAYFDSRCWTIPDRTEVMNYFIWRNQDCIRNSVSMVAQSMFSPKELHGVNSLKKKQMILEKSGSSWDDMHPSLQYGRFIKRHSTEGHWNVESAYKISDNQDAFLANIPNYPNTPSTQPIVMPLVTQAMDLNAKSSYFFGPVT